ncbi:MAG: 1-acyl-sn-glycerol-3-phosphate acyltransferase [Pseudomonadota bacterium]
MTQTVELPLWLFVVVLLFAAVTFASHFLFPSVRWFLRRRLERAVSRLNERLTVKIEPFRLLRRQDMIQRIIYDPQVTQAIVEYAAEHGVREDVAFERARRYAREIVPSFSAFTYFGFGIRAARWLATSLYDVRTGEMNDALLRDLPEGSTVIFVMNHRSNMDYVLVTYLAARASALSYAVGEWARVWPLSRLIKSMGAYFIRRRSRGQLYRKVLARYVHMATAGGVTQAIFPEGGLSLDGRLAPPKMGLLSYVLDAHLETGREVLFVPVAINYDRVLEDRVLTAAGEAGTRRFQARISVILRFILSKLWQRVTGRFHRFGAAAVVFGAPIRLSDYVHVPDARLLATDLLDKVSGVMPVLFVPLLARVLLNATGPLDTDALKEAVTEEIAQARTTVMASAEAIEPALERARAALLERKLIREAPEGIVAVPEERGLLQYYANSIAHFFADAADDAAIAGS